MSILEIIRRYGKYLGGLDYEKIIHLLQTENERLRDVEIRLLKELHSNTETENILSHVQHTASSSDVVYRKLEVSRVKSKLEKLKEEEKNLTNIIIDLKTRGATLYEIRKASHRLRVVKREITRLRKLLKYLEES